MVYSYHGMTAARTMRTFLDLGESKALLLKTVLDEGVRFKAEFAQLEAEYPDLAYHRVLGLAGVAVLNHRNFPDLYCKSVAWARKVGRLTGNFLTSQDIVTYTNKSKIEQWAIQDMITEKGLTDANRLALEGLGHMVPSEMLTSEIEKQRKLKLDLEE